MCEKVNSEITHERVNRIFIHQILKKYIRISRNNSQKF